MTARDLAALREALAAGGVALLPTDTVYGLVAALDAPGGVEALYRLKGRDRATPSQVLVYSPRARAAALDRLAPPVRAAADAVLPGPATCIVPDPEGRYAAAAGRERGSVGIRAPRVSGELATLDDALVATSANEPGEPDPATLGDVPARLRDAVAQAWDGGRLPGTPSSVIDLRPVATGGDAVVLREGHDLEATLAVLGGVGVATV